MGYRPKFKSRNCKTLRGKHRTLFDMNHSKTFFDPPPRVMETKPKINKWDLVKQKLLYSKVNYKQDEKTTLRMGNIIANKTTEKGLISKIYKQLMRLNIRKTTQSTNRQKT